MKQRRRALFVAFVLFQFALVPEKHFFRGHEEIAGIFCAQVVPQCCQVLLGNREGSADEINGVSGEQLGDLHLFP